MCWVLFEPKVVWQWDSGQSNIPPRPSLCKVAGSWFRIDKNSPIKNSPVSLKTQVVEVRQRSKKVNWIITEFPQLLFRRVSVKQAAFSLCRNVSGELLRNWIWMGKSEKRLQLSALESWLQRMQVFFNSICWPVVISNRQNVPGLTSFGLEVWWPEFCLDSVCSFPWFLGHSLTLAWDLLTCYYSLLEDWVTRPDQRPGLISSLCFQMCSCKWLGLIFFF